MPFSACRQKGARDPRFPCPLLKSPHPSYPGLRIFVPKMLPGHPESTQSRANSFSVSGECRAQMRTRAATLRVRAAHGTDGNCLFSSRPLVAGRSRTQARVPGMHHGRLSTSTAAKSCTRNLACTPFPWASPFFSARGGIHAPLSAVTPIYFHVTSQKLHGRVAFFRKKSVGLRLGGKDNSKRRRGTMGASPSFEVCSKRPARHMRLESQYPQNKKIQRETNFLISR